jgi:hypothetical protein
MGCRAVILKPLAKYSASSGAPSIRKARESRYASPMFTENLALSKHRLLSDGCQLTILWRRNCDNISGGVLRRRTRKAGYSQIRVRESRFWRGRIQENWLVPAAAKVGLGRIGWHTFFSATCARCGSQSSTRVATACGYSHHDEYLHARSSYSVEKGKQQSCSIAASVAGRVSLMLP